MSSTWLLRILFRHTKVVTIIINERLIIPKINPIKAEEFWVFSVEDGNFVVIDKSEAGLARLMFTGDSEGTEISVSPQGTGAKEVFEILGAAVPLSSELGSVTITIGTSVVVLGMGENMVWCSIGKTVVSALEEIWVSGLVRIVDWADRVVKSGVNSVVVLGMGENMVWSSIGKTVVSVLEIVKLDSFVVWIVEVIGIDIVIVVIFSVRIFVEAVDIVGWKDQTHW